RSSDLANAIVRIALSIGMVLIWKRNRAFLGLDRLAAAQIAYVLGLFLLAFRPDVPDFVHVVGGTTVLAVAAALLLEGCRELYGRRPLGFTKAIAALVVASGNSYYLLVEPSFRARNVLIAG